MTPSYAPTIVLFAAIMLSLLAVKTLPTPDPPTQSPPVASERPPRPAAPGFSGVPVPDDAPLTEKEQHEMTIHTSPEMCAEAGKRLNTFSHIADDSPKKFNAQAMCNRFGNIAWFRCVEATQSIEDVRTCNRRLIKRPSSR